MTDPAARLSAALADRYRLEREIGAGGMATVYLAEDLRHHRQVAVKVFRPELAATLGSERFFREIEVAARLQHPHILPLHDSGEAGGYLYYVMPFVPGESLRERLTGHGELPIHDAVRILSEVVDALAYAHSMGVVHRDIKPDNVMLSGRHALVTDFGIAKAVSEATGRQALTTAGIALGTPSYMAPEQAVADPHLDHRVDIYAVGAVGYEMLTGQPPFHGRSAQEILAAQVTQAPEPVTARRAAVPPVLAAVIMKCLEKRPADRWQSAEELLDQLEVLATPSAGLTPTQSRPAVALPPKRGVPRWLAWAGGGALVAAGALALTLMQRQPATITLGKRSAIAFAPEWETYVDISPDGKTLAYTRSDPRGFEVLVQQADGGSAVPVTTQLPGYQCCGAFSPDGTRLLLWQQRTLEVMPTLGGQARTVVSAAPGSPAPRWGDWAPDGNRIVFPQGDTLFVQSIDSSDKKAVAAGEEIHSPAWSPDGRWIVYVQGNPAFHINGNTASSAIRVVPAIGGSSVVVAEATALNTSPIWVPGRRAILFISDREGGRDIYEVSLKGSGMPIGNPVRITTGLNPERISISADGHRLAWSVITQTSNVWSIPIPARDSVPLSSAHQVTTGTQNIELAAASPDGAWVYFDSDRSGNFDIWRQPTSGGEPAQLTTDPAGDFFPDVSPDGREIAFHSLRTGNREIFVMPAGGGPAAQVSNSPGDDRVATWSPDGRTLLWHDTEREDSDSSLWISRRRDDGTWSPPAMLPGRELLGHTQWSPDGRKIVSASAAGLMILEVASGRQTVIRSGIAPVYFAWAHDGQSIYGPVLDSTGRTVISAWPIAGGRPRTLVYADNPPIQGYRYGFDMVGDRFYLPLVEVRADVWVAEVEPR